MLLNQYFLQCNRRHVVELTARLHEWRMRYEKDRSRAKSIEAYDAVFEEFRARIEQGFAFSKWTLRFTRDKNGLDFHGENGDGEKYAMGFEGWDVMLGSEVITVLSIDKTVALFLWETTFYGWREEDILGQKAMLNQRCNEAKHCMAKKQKLCSFSFGEYRWEISVGNAYGRWIGSVARFANGKHSIEVEYFGATRAELVRKMHCNAMQAYRRAMNGQELNWLD